MVMQEICDNEEIGFEGGQYASTEEELYEKAIALLEMCKIETRRSGKITEPTAETRQYPCNAHGPRTGRIPKLAGRGESVRSSRRTP